MYSMSTLWQHLHLELPCAIHNCTLKGPEPTLGTSAKVAREVIRGRTSGKHEEYWQSIQGQGQAKGFLKRLSAKRTGELLNLSRNQLNSKMGLLTVHCHLKVHLFKLGLVDSPMCERCKKAFETYVLTCSL